MCIWKPEVLCYKASLQTKRVPEFRMTRVSLDQSCKSCHCVSTLYDTTKVNDGTESGIRIYALTPPDASSTGFHNTRC